MASKRGLYTPTLQTNGIQSRRKPLAQGRLVTDPAPRMQPAAPSLQQGTLDPRVAETQPGSVPHRPQSKRDQQYVSAERLRSHQVAVQSLVEQLQSLSPRREKPLLAECASPHMPCPSSSLDLSDTDSEKSLNLEKVPGVGSPPGNNPVLVVDASGKTGSVDQSEVDIHMGFVYSPVRVVRHTPAHGSSSIREGSSRDSHVFVDSVPSISVLSSHDPPSPPHTQPSAQTQSGQSDESLEKRDVVKQLFQQETADQEAAENDSRTDNSATSLTSAQNSLSDDSKDQKKKKKGFRVISSRYMQAQAPSKGPMKATDRTVLTKSVKTSRTSTRPGVSTSTRKPQPNSKPLSTSARRKHGKSSTFSSTPEASTGRAMSTPTTETTHLPPANAVDVSAIAGPNMHSSVLSCASGGTPGMISHSHLSTTKSSSLRNTSNSTADTRDKKPELNGLQLELLYSRYIQMVYLESRAKHSFHQQEQHAMAQLNGMFEENDKLRRVLVEKTEQRDSLQHLNGLDEMLNVQEEGLDAVNSSLGQLKTRHSTLADAVDAITHHVAVRDIHIPDEGGLERVLLESEQLLGELCAMTRLSLPAAKSHAQTLQQLQQTTHTQLQQADKCQELVAAAQTLTTHECSLRIQDMTC